MLTNGNRAPGHIDTIKHSLQLTFKKETQHMNEKLLKFLKTAFWPFHNPNRETNLTALMTLCGFTLLAVCEIGARAFGWPPPSPLINEIGRGAFWVGIGRASNVSNNKLD